MAEINGPLAIILFSIILTSHIIFILSTFNRRFNDSESLSLISGLLTYYNEKSCDFQNYKISRLFLSEIWYDQWESHHKTSTYSPQVKNSDAFWLNIPLFYRFCNYLYNPVYINIQSATVLVVKWEAFRPVFLSVIAKNLYLIIFSLDNQLVFFWHNIKNLMNYLRKLRWTSVSASKVV